MWLLSGMPLWSSEPDPRVRSTLTVLGVAIAVGAQLGLASMWDAEHLSREELRALRSRPAHSRSLALLTLAVGAFLIVRPLLLPFFDGIPAVGAVLGGVLFYSGWRVVARKRQRA
jgi:hypothetical protein